jgi:hypothetical protein
VHTLAAHGVSGCEALVLHAATGVPEREHLQANRGWDDEQWHDATVALVERGWLAADGTLTRDGAAGRRAIEDDTDRLALVPYARLGRERVDALAAALEAITQRLASSDVMPYPNPMGVPRP